MQQAYFEIRIIYDMKILKISWNIVRWSLSTNRGDLSDSVIVGIVSVGENMHYLIVFIKKNFVSFISVFLETAKSI